MIENIGAFKKTKSRVMCSLLEESNMLACPGDFVLLGSATSLNTSREAWQNNICALQACLTCQFGLIFWRKEVYKLCVPLISLINNLELFFYRIFSCKNLHSLFVNFQKIPIYQFVCLLSLDFTLIFTFFSDFTRTRVFFKFKLYSDISFSRATLTFLNYL